jgi:hypothetical protein
MPVIESTIRVIELIKPTAEPSTIRTGSSITVKQPGGVAMENGVELVAGENGLAAFRPGEKFVLFLADHEGWGWVPDFSSASVYRVAGDVVRIPGSARLSAERKAAFGNRESMPLQELLELLRARRGQQEATAHE